MRISRAVLVLCAVAGAAAAGLLSAGGPGPYPFETLHGERAEIWGRGLYRYDTVFTAAGSRATDLVVLLLGLPLLVLEVLLAPLIIAQTVAQLLAGVRFTVPEVVDPMGGFVVLAGASAAVLVAVLRAVGDEQDGTGPRTGHGRRTGH